MIGLTIINVLYYIDSILSKQFLVEAENVLYFYEISGFFSFVFISSFLSFCCVCFVMYVTYWYSGACKQYINKFTWGNGCSVFFTGGCM